MPGLRYSTSEGVKIRPLRETLTIGRDARNDLALPDDPKVSRQHARINHVDGQWTVTDLNSTNYTRVDGNKLDPSLPAPIKDGSRIQFGRIVVTFRE